MALGFFRKSVFVALFVLISFWIFSPVFAQVATIDNDIPEEVIGHWSMIMRTGGESGTALMTTRTIDGEMRVAESVLYEYTGYVDVGDQVAPIRLFGTDPQADPTDPDTVSSTGVFTGANGNTITWKATSSIPNNEMVMTNKIEFHAAIGESLGKLRFYQYLDEDVESISDDVFFTTGTVSGKNLALSVRDAVQEYGISQSGAFDEVGGLRNARYVGWAADIYDNIQPRLETHTQSVPEAGMIQNLPAYTHPHLGAVYGPGDTVSVIAWDVIDTNQRDMTVVSTVGGLYGEIDTESPILPSNFNLSASTTSSFSIAVSWNPATDNIGVVSYIIERCQGLSCSNFSQVGTSTSSPFVDTGLAANTGYSYHVRARDAAGNLSGWSNVVGAITQTAPFAACNIVTPSNFSQASYNGYGAPFDLFAGNALLIGTKCMTSDPHVAQVTIGKIGDTTRITYTKGYYYDPGVSNWVQYSGTCTGTVNGGWCAGTTIATITDPDISTASVATPAYFVGMVCSVQNGGWRCGCRDATCNNFYWMIQGAGM